jgi:acyl-CoA synthetase (AMP-forming)/AMP-acid ligase II
MDLSTFAAAKECGSRTAVIWEAGSFSYAQLAERVGIACAALGQRGYGPATRLAIRASNRWPTLVLILACIERGIPFVAIHPRWTQREVQVVMQDARPVALCGDAEVDSLTAGEHIDGASPFTSSAVDISDAAPLASLVLFGNHRDSERGNLVAGCFCRQRARECRQPGLAGGRSLAALSTAVPHWRTLDCDALPTWATSHGAAAQI